MDRPHTAPDLNGAAALAALAAQDWQAPYDFAGYEARLRRSRERAALVQKLGVASLACVGLAVIALMLVTGTPDGASGNAAGGPQVLSLGDDHDRGATPRVVDERWLIGLPEEPALARSATRVPVSALEDRIAWLDDSLSAALQEPATQADVRRIHAERRQLVDALVRVRYAEQLSTQFN